MRKFDFIGVFQSFEILGRTHQITRCINGHEVKKVIPLSSSVLNVTLRLFYTDLRHIHVGIILSSGTFGEKNRATDDHMKIQRPNARNLLLG